MRWPKYWSVSFSTSPSNERSGLISFRMDLSDLLAVQGTLKRLLQHYSSQESILWCSTFFIVQLSHPYMTTRENIALTGQIFIGNVMSLLFHMLSRLVITFLPRSEHLWISWLWSPSAVILLPAAAKSLQSCLTLCDPMECSVPGFSIMGFSRQEHWSGLSFPSPMHESESEVVQSCLTLSDPMDCSLPSSSIHGITLFNKDSILIQKRNQTLYRQTKTIRIQNHQTFMVNAEGSSLDQIRSDQLLSRVQLFENPWFAARQASLSITNSQSSLRLTSIESVMPSNHLILCRPLFLLPPIPPSIRVFSSESTLRMR